MAKEKVGYRREQARRDRASAADRGSVSRWAARLAANDAKHGRDSKDNPNNKKNGKW